MNFARVCIEVDSKFSFPSSINVVVLNDDNEEIIDSVSIEYQSRPPSCPSCKVFGHSPLKCPKASFKWVPKVQVPESSGHVAPLMDGNLAALTKSPLPAVAPVQDEWTKVEKRKAIPSAPNVALLDPVGTPISNPFLPIYNISEVTPSSSDATPMPNPLVAKLKNVDEKDCKDLKSKLNPLFDDDSVSKKKKKRNGGRGSP